MLELEHISVRFAAGHGVQAVEDVTLTLEDGGRLAIVGETGSGKSVLLLAVLQLLPGSALVSGSARLDGEDLFAAGQKRLREIRGGVISYVPQGGGASLNPLYSVGFQVGEPLMEHRGYSKKKAFLASIPLLKRFQLGREEQLAKGYPHTFSGGMRQRAMVAMGISAGARIIFADEPTKGLDAYAKAELAQLLLTLCREGTSILIVTHDVEFAARYATGCALMFDGLLLSEGEPHDFFAGNRFYTTDANRIAAEHFPTDITCEEVIASCRSSLSAAAPEPPRG